MADVTSITRKLKKLLALSTSPNEAEAISALNKAQELMDRYGIRTIDVDEETNSVDIGTSYVDGYTKRRSAWETKLAATIAGCFDGEAIVEYYKGGWQVMFLASKTDTDIITDLFIRLRRIISKMSTQYASTLDTHKGKAKKAYCVGAIETLHVRLQRMYNMSDVNALVVVKKDAIAEEMEKRFGELKQVKDKPPTDIWAYLQGVEDANDININRTLQSVNRTAKIG